MGKTHPASMAHPGARSNCAAPLDTSNASCYSWGMGERAEKSFVTISKSNPRLVRWTFEPGQRPLPPESWAPGPGEERYDGEDVVMVRRFEALNGWSQDTYRTFMTHIPRAKAEALYRDLIRKGFTPVEQE